MRSVRFRFRIEFRHRWRAWVGVGVLVGAFGGVTIAGAAGARRTETAYSRFEQGYHAANFLVEDFIPNPDAVHVTHAQVEATAGVGDAQVVRSFSFQSIGLDGPPPATPAEVALLGIKVGNVQFLATPDGRAYGTGLDRPKLISGRLPDPTKADEVAVDFTLPKARVGERITVPFDRSVNENPHRVDYSASPLTLTFTVVGVVAVPGQFPPQPGNSYFTGASIYATPAFSHAHTSDLGALEVDLVQTSPGARYPMVDRNLQALGLGKPVPTVDLTLQSAEVRRSTHLEAIALWIASSLIGIVGLLVLGQLLARMTALEARDTPTLRALGMSRGQVFVVGLLRVAGVGFLGACLAGILAVALSPLTPIGLARLAEPLPGISMNWAVLGLGAVAVAVGCLLMAALPLWRSTSALSTRDDDARARPSVAVARLAGAGASATATCGAWMALERGRGRTAVPVRSTLTGVIVGLTALVAAITFGASLTHLLKSPALYGVTWDTDVLSHNGPAGLPAAEPILMADPDVAAAAYRYAGLNATLNRSYDTQDVTFRPVTGDLGPVIVEGRVPVGDTEIAFGTRTMQELHLRIGDTVRGVAENPHAGPVPLRIVGVAVLPPGRFGGRLGIGVVVDEVTLERMAGVAGGYALRRPYIISVQFRQGVNVVRATKSLAEALTAANPQFGLEPPPQPNDLVNFGRIQNLPLILAAMLAVLAAATLAHLLVSSVRRRRGDLALLKILGFDRGQIRRTVAWQATILALIAALVGIPLGVAAGRIGWTLLAMNLGTLPLPVTPWALLVAVVPATIVVGNLMAAVPARFASRVLPAVALRGE
jgi:ABC-type lipoprotein release transport system permease subunit